MKTDVKVGLLKERLTSLMDKDNRCERRRNELTHRQNILFKILSQVITRYSSLGFSIVFTGERNLLCHSPLKEEKADLFSFPVPTFSIVHKVPRFKNSAEQEPSSTLPVLLTEEVVRFRFSPNVNGNGGIDYRFEEFIPGVSYAATGYLSWQSKSMLDDGDYWHFNVSPSEGLQNRPVDLECVEEWLTRMYTRNAMIPKQ